MKFTVKHQKVIIEKWHVSSLVLLLLIELLMCSATSAQSGAGSIQGTVQDTTQAVIPGATIQVLNDATNISSTTKSNGVGFYEVPGLFAGTYTVTVSAPGMKTYKTSIQLLVAQAVVINPIMTPGAVTQQVEVAANSVQLTTTDNGTITSTLENARINQLPMNGRMLMTELSNTTLGMEQGLEGVGQRLNGLMPEALEYVADGVPMTNRNFGGEISESNLPDPDAVEEVRMETNNTSAMYSEPATGIITTKSGTNSLHGSLFETARNNAWGIARQRQDPANFAAPHLVRNEFGASAGGPIVLPHVYHGKDKSFWFFAYERYSYATASNELVTVPPTAWRQGDFSGLTDSSGIYHVLYDPATTAPSTNCNGTGTATQYCRAPFPNNQIPIGRLAPAAKILNDITPPPTSAANPLVSSNLTEPNTIFQIIPTITFRLDHSINENNKAYLRYTQTNELNTSLRNNPAAAPGTIAADGFPNGATGYTTRPTTSFASALSYTHVFSPTFFSETIFGQQWWMEYVGGGGNPNLNYENMLGLPNNFGETGFPSVGTNLVMPFYGTMFQYQENQIISNLDENLTKTIGKHQMQFGGRYRHERFGYLPDRSADSVAFGALATALEDPATTASKTYGALPNTGSANADFFLGAASSYSVTLEPPFVHFHDMEFDAYYQDNYHVSKDLTLNIGLRYEAHPSPWTKYNLNEGFDLKNDAIVFAKPISYYISNGYTTQAIITNLTNLGVVFETASQAGFPDTMMRNYNLNFNPRVGFAYQPFGGRYGTVVRAAYGRYTYPMPVRNSVKNMVANSPFTASYSQSYTSAAQSPDGGQNYLLRAPQSVIMGSNSSDVVNSSTTNSILPGINLQNFSPNLAPDFVTQMNVTVEQQMKGNSALRVSWVWSHGTNLDHLYYYNYHPSTYVWEMQTGIVPPTGGASTIGTNQYSTTATGPYDKITYGSSATLISKDGWSNDNALQVNYQRLYHKGIAYQIGYVWSKALRMGGNTFRDSTVYTAQDYIGNSGTIGTMTSPYGTVITPSLPPSRPTGIAPYANWHDLNKYEGYIQDSGIPKQHIIFSSIVDLPFGRGKKFLGNSNRLMNELVGGFQIAGDGSIFSQVFQTASANWGPTNPLHVYKHNAPITDCRSGVCYKSYLWFNGFLAPGVINASSKGVSGVPSGYAPYSSPIDTTYPNTDKYYGTNTVNVTLANGQVVPNTYSPGPTGNNPFNKTFLNGPNNYTVDLSLFKVFPITERVSLRFNADAFNALNVQGYNNPNTTDGTESLLSSYNPGNTTANNEGGRTSRQVQFTMRLTF